MLAPRAKLAEAPSCSWDVGATAAALPADALRGAVLVISVAPPPGTLPPAFELPLTRATLDKMPLLPDTEAVVAVTGAKTAAVLLATEAAAAVAAACRINAALVTGAPVVVQLLLREAVVLDDVTPAAAAACWGRLLVGFIRPLLLLLLLLPPTLPLPPIRLIRPMLLIGFTSPLLLLLPPPMLLPLLLLPLPWDLATPAGCERGWWAGTPSFGWAARGCWLLPEAAPFPSSTGRWIEEAAKAAWKPTGGVRGR